MSALSTEKNIAVIGAGTMGAGIAQVAAQSGHTVLLFDAAEGAAANGIAKIGSGLSGLVERGKFTNDEVDGILSRLKPVSEIEELAPASLVIEAIIEDLTIKQDLFKNLENICGKDAILATNTSSLSITAIGSALLRPENFVGMHFFNPAQVMKLVEVVSGADTSPDIAETIYQTAVGWGKKPVHATSTPGFIVNRVARPFYGEALRILEEQGAAISDIDAIMKESAGFRMGPFELMDLIGNDINLAVTKSVFKSFHYDPRYKPSLIQEELVAAGKLGRKSGNGYYDYRDEKTSKEAFSAPEKNAPEEICVYGDMGIAAPLVQLIDDAGIKVKVKEAQNDQGFLEVGSAKLFLSDGSLATERGGNTVFFDLALDFEKASRIAISPADQCDPTAVDSVAGLFQALEKSVSIVDDIPGIIVMRTICMLANEGAEAVNQGVCDEEAVDVAMCYGVNYPAGPLQWADKIGVGFVEKVLDNLARIYGDSRYRCSPLIRRKSITGAPFRD